jgi:hypothetical protein
MQVSMRHMLIVPAQSGTCVQGHAGHAEARSRANHAAPAERTLPHSAAALIRTRKPARFPWQNTRWECHRLVTVDAAMVVLDAGLDLNETICLSET